MQTIRKFWSFRHQETARWGVAIVLLAGTILPAGASRGNNALALGSDNAPVAVQLRDRFVVDENGNATYLMPIQVPPGIQGKEPVLHLTYSSSRANGRLGVGWAVQGSSAITRCKATPPVDGFRGTVSYGPQDRYCLDGQRLINVTGDYGAANSVYRTELETWRQVTASSEMCGSGPCSFTVVNKTGHISRYGVTDTSSQIKAVGRTDVRVWALANTIDNYGNAVEWSYTQSPIAGVTAKDGQYYLQRVDYTSNESANVAANRSVCFLYEARPDAETVYVGGGQVTTKARLTHVRTFVGETAVKDYQISYGDPSQSTGRSLISTITECAGTGDNTTCLPVTHLSWQGTSTVGLRTLGTNFNLTSSDKLNPADVNGDGRADLVQWWTDSGQTTIAAY